MCMLAILFRAIEGCPVLVAANREEFYDRQGSVPEICDGEPAIMAGRDPRAGGTWLGVNRYGVLVAVTNRAKLPQPSQPRSRGLLCRDLLTSRTAREAHERALNELDHHSYAGCNVLAIDAAGAYVIHAGSLLQSNPLPPGMHVLTTHNLNDTRDDRTSHLIGWLTSRTEQTVDGWLQELPGLCSDHGGPAQPSICLHAPDRGTVSSSIIALPDQRAEVRWLHAQGPPCRNPFADLSRLLAELVFA